MHTITLDGIEGWSGAPLVVFVGVSTGGSLAHAVFDRWAAALDRPWRLRGLDLPVDTPPETYRRLFADTSPAALDDLRAVAGRAGADGVRLAYVPVKGPDDCDALVAGPPAPQLVVNATGLGKDAPGSPVTGRAPFGSSTLAWDFNYRGGRTFLRQAAARGARTMDGWDYFVAGWTGCLTAIAGVPFTAGVLAGFAEAAAPYRPQETLYRPQETA
jgi:shikimate dehydrogenase